MAGLPLPTATPLDLASAFGAANAVIAPFGLRLEPPQVTKATADREVRVTPLKLVLGDGTAAKPLLGPLMSNLQPAREALLEAMGRFKYGECGAGNGAGLAFTFVDVVAAAMGGSGGIDLELGGVLATTEGVDYGDPFGLIPPGLPTVAPVVAPAVRPSPPAPECSRTKTDALPVVRASTPGRSDLAPAPAEAAAPVAAAAPPSGEPVAALPATRRCESTSRGRVAGCSRGAPLQASAAALGLAVAAVRRRLVAHPPPTPDGGAAMTTPSRGRLPGAEHTMFGGYGPFVALLALIVAMAFLAPTHRPRTRGHDPPPGSRCTR